MRANLEATEARFPFKRKRLRWQAAIMVATASIEHSYWLALAFVA